MKLCLLRFRYPREFKFCAWIVTLLCSSPTAFARPVAFVGGTSAMNDNSPEQAEIFINHTFTQQLAIGVRGFFLRTPANDKSLPDRGYIFPFASVLLVRNNESGRQSNVYLGSGIGLGKSDDNRHEPSWSAALDADTESRIWFAGINTIWIQSLGKSKTNGFWQAKLRLGHAPFTASMGGLHIFVLGELAAKSQFPTRDFSSILRFSHQNVLWELGMSARGRWQFNWMIEV